MSTWIRNLKTRLEDRSVVILHGNVRDKYIDAEGRVYENLTALLTAVAQALPLSFTELIFYDPVGQERRQSLTQSSEQRRPAAPENDEFAATTPTAQPISQEVTPTRVLANWRQQLSANDHNRFVTIFYLDKLVAYKTNYQDDERKTLLWLEKVIENMTPNHRLVLVALQDTLVPIELYSNAPKTCVLPIPIPEKADRLAYLRHRLGAAHPHRDLIADLSDGLFLRDLDNIVAVVSGQADLGTREVRRLVNKYRIGEQADYWGTLNIERIDSALQWFVQDEGVKGQEEPIQKIVDMLTLARAGLSGVASGTVSKPKGVLFFAGPTGVGKTFLAKKLAKFLFSTEEAFLRFDMSEFKEEHTVSKLIGSPPGYVGSERGGMLTNAVRERPFAVILFDEIEKAHPKIMDIFLQMLSDGRLTDSRGQTVFFTETAIIFTSNLGTRTIDSRGVPVDEREALDAIVNNKNLSPDEKMQAIQDHFTRAVERFFMIELSRPELLNRIGKNIVPFNYIHTREVQQEIVNSHLHRIKEDFEDKYRSAGHRLVFTEQVPERLVDKHSQRISIFGGKGTTDAIETEIMMPLARAVLRAEHNGQQHVTFQVQNTTAGKVIVEMA